MVAPEKRRWSGEEKVDVGCPDVGAESAVKEGVQAKDGDGLVLK